MKFMIRTQETVTRDTQKADTVYALPGGGYFVSPDGEGRFWFDTLEELEDQYGDDAHTMPLVRLEKGPTD